MPDSNLGRHGGVPRVRDVASLAHKHPDGLRAEGFTKHVLRDHIVSIVAVFYRGVFLIVEQVGPWWIDHYVLATELGTVVWVLAKEVGLELVEDLASRVAHIAGIGRVGGQTQRLQVSERIGHRTGGYAEKVCNLRPLVARSQEVDRCQGTRSPGGQS